MPNTLIHIAIQAPLSRSLFSRRELPWILIGAIIPDIPWILQRVLQATQLVDPYSLRLYCTIQASLLFSLLPCLALASLAEKFGRVFLLLAFNCLLHLILDSLQIKWGNGVHLLAPFTWQTTSLGLIWPENLLTTIATLMGLLYLVVQSRVILRQGVTLNFSPSLPILTCSLLLYLFSPLPLMKTLEQSNANYVLTVRDREHRTGKPIEIDRGLYTKKASTIRLFSGELIRVTGVVPETTGIISLRGRFTSPQSIESTLYHQHNTSRDAASKVGLFSITMIWLFLLLRIRKPLTGKG